MSMSSLAEGVCGICNIRCYQRDLRRVPLNKMPSIELPKTPEDLCSVVPCIQRTQNLHSNEKYNINNDVDLAMVESEADVDYDRKNAATGAELPIQETERVEKEVIPTCLPTPNSTHDDFQRIFRNDVVRIVETSNIHRHSANCYKYSKANPDGLKTCRMRVPRALVENSHIDVSTGQITMRRSYPWINNFNEWLINACRCNMDIKFIWTGSDAKALVYYITVYVTKSSLAFYDMFALAQQEIKSIEQQHMGLKMLLKNRANSCYAVLRYDYFTSSSFWCSSGIVSSELWRSLHYAHI
ncbi:unnamed protein product [Rotaria socialis]|uniref:Uncharacterized protein n=1 Tax=Rotaria socialis TaxID=392032 RepID=A0A818BRW3_9BILA|nr:unnamed protein product [Rotaria socialis]